VFTNVIGAFTSLLPKYFIFSSYVPVLIFGFINAGLLYLLSAWFRHAVNFALTVSQPLTIAVAFVATVVAAYVVASVNDFLRKTLEGKYRFWPLLFRKLFAKSEQRRRYMLQVGYQRARHKRFALEGRITKWQQCLRDAASLGSQPKPRDAVTHGHCAADRQAAPYDAVYDPAAVALRELRSEASQPEQLNESTIAPAVDSMACALTKNDIRKDDGLASDYRDLLALMTIVLSAATQREYDDAMELATTFGTGTPAPTRMGNIAAAIQGYAVGLYGLDLTVFFSRLQSYLVKIDDKGYAIVQEAKTQLDFLVACCWFSAASTILWFVVLSLQGGYLLLYFAVAVFGPFATIAAYFLACENYRAYGEVVRACVDLNRFALLRALDIPLPMSTRDERRIWGILSRAAVSALENVELSYEHLKP
jgi:hypothetical protein